MMDYVGQAVSTATGAIVGFVTAKLFDRQKDRKIGEVESRVGALETKRVADVELALADLRKDGCTVGIGVSGQLQTVISQNNDILLQLRKLNRESENQATRIEVMERSASKIWDKFDEHRQHHPPAEKKGD